MIEDIEKYQKAGKEIFNKLHLSTYPVAIKYIKSVDEIPNGVKRPVDEGKKMCICQTFTMARRHGHTIAITAVDNFCTPSTVGHGWVQISKEEFVESQIRQGWHKDKKAEERRAERVYEKQFNKVKDLGYFGLISSPLLKTLVIPDSILIYGTGTKITNIIHALCFEHKKRYLPSSSFEGFGESCGKGAFRPFLLQRPQIVIPGAGDRAFAGIQDHEIAIGFPANHIFYILKNLFKTGASQGIGFPARQLIPLGLDENITPGFKYMQELIDKKLKKD